MLKLISKILNKTRFDSFRAMSEQISHKKIVWMDMEMTGLDVDKCKVLQVAILVTDEQLNVISPDFCTIIHQNDETLNNMNDWCKENLKDLAESSKNSQITETKAEDMMMEYLRKYVATPNVSPLAGNTIYMDRMFLRKYFPAVDQYLHYRIIDVSTVKELCRRWNPSVYNNVPKKRLKHRALDDIKESLNELKYYKENLFKNE